MADGRTLIIEGTDAMILLYHLYRAHKEFGHLDAEHTMEQLIAALTPRHRVKKEVLESALCSTNLLAEQDKFWHPRGYSVEQFLNKVCDDTGLKFNRAYHWLEDEE